MCVIDAPPSINKPVQGARGPHFAAAPEDGISALASGDSTISASGGLPGRYASALYAHASDTHELDTVVDQMSALGRLIDESHDLRRVLESPVIELNTAMQAVRSVLQEQGFGKTVMDFVGVIAVNRRLPALRAIVSTFAALVAEKRGVVVAHVATAHALSNVQEQQLRARLIECGYGNVDIQKKVDPSLLGGLVLRIGARLFDSSLKSRLQRLQYAMKGAA
jgi:F-type H+-transporting ATPase subunit delta